MEYMILVFTDIFNLKVLNLAMENLIQTLKKSSIIPEKLGYLSPRFSEITELFLSVCTKFSIAEFSTIKLKLSVKANIMYSTQATLTHFNPVLHFHNY